MKKAIIITVLVLVAGGGIYAYSTRQKTTIIENDSAKKSLADAGSAGSSSASVSSDAASEDIPSGDNGQAVSSSSQSSSSSKSSSSSSSSSLSDLSGTFKIISRLVGFGFEKSSGRSIDTLIVHSSYDAIGNDPYDVSGVIAEYKGYGVSPHYLIDRKGNVYRLVEDQNIAYHAGESKMPDGRTGVNNFSIGVEILTTKSDKPTDAQYGALNSLIDYLKGKYKIKNILGHDQIAPGRKDDPWNFDWGKVDK